MTISFPFSYIWMTFTWEISKQKYCISKIQICRTWWIGMGRYENMLLSFRHAHPAQVYNRHCAATKWRTLFLWYSVKTVQMWPKPATTLHWLTVDIIGNVFKLFGAWKSTSSCLNREEHYLIDLITWCFTVILKPVTSGPLVVGTALSQIMACRKDIVRTTKVYTLGWLLYPLIIMP